jgi:Holliday junction resolvase
MINRKAKGTKGERELVKAFNEAGWSCVRVAGSGSSRYPSPDILAGNAIRRLAIECKVTREKKKYFNRLEIEQLSHFSKKFGSEPWVGVKFPDEPWYFLMLEDLEETKTGYGLSLLIAQRRGLNFIELLGNSDKNRNI